MRLVVVVAVSLLVAGGILGQYWLVGPLPGDDRLAVRQGGATTLGAPARAVWTATVGADLCTSGDPVTVGDVQASTSGDIRDLTFQVLTMRPEDRRAAGSGGYGSAAGSPPAFAEPYADGDPLPGDYAPAVGAEVTAPCGPDAGGAAEEQTLLIVATVGPRGGVVADVSVTHRSWGRDREAVGEVGLTVICGVEQTTDGCPGLSA